MAARVSRTLTNDHCDKFIGTLIQSKSFNTFPCYETTREYFRWCQTWESGEKKVGRRRLDEEPRFSEYSRIFVIVLFPFSSILDGFHFGGGFVR